MQKKKMQESEKKAHHCVAKCASTSVHTSGSLFIWERKGMGGLAMASAEHPCAAHAGGFQAPEQEEMLKANRENPAGGRREFGGVVSSSETFSKILGLFGFKG